MTSRGSEYNWGTRPSRRQYGKVKCNLLNFIDWLKLEAIDGPSSSHPPPDQQSDSEPDILEQVDA